MKDLIQVHLSKSCQLLRGKTSIGTLDSILLLTACERVSTEMTISSSIIPVASSKDISGLVMMVEAGTIIETIFYRNRKN